MKVKTMSALAGLGGTLILSCAANADLVGLSIEPVLVGGAGAPPTGGPRTIFHVYADFTSATDRVNVWGGGGTLGAGVIQNVLADNATLGTGFTNIGGAGGQLAPYSPNTTRDWDTYMTIGVRYGQEGPGAADATAQLPGAITFIAGNTWTAAAAGTGVFITPDDDQGMAGYRVDGSDTNLRVLLMQLVVNAGQLAKGTIGVSWSVDGVQGSGGVVSGLTFAVPAPGALALLGLAGVVGTRRRRG